MFGWLRAKQDPKQMGQKAAQSFAADLERLMEGRFKPVSVAFLDQVQGQYNKCMAPTTAPPIVMARVEYNVFVENVDGIRAKMMDEITARLSGWMDLADQMQSRDKLTEHIQGTVDRFCRDLSDAGLQRFLDMVYAQKLADDQWRVAHPELSAKFPPDT